MTTESLETDSGTVDGVDGEGYLVDETGDRLPAEDGAHLRVEEFVGVSEDGNPIRG